MLRSVQKPANGEAGIEYLYRRTCEGVDPTLMREGDRDGQACLVASEVKCAAEQGFQVRPATRHEAGLDGRPLVHPVQELDDVALSLKGPCRLLGSS